MQSLAAGEALKRLEKLNPGPLIENFPAIHWKGAIGFWESWLPVQINRRHEQQQLATN
jgi:hypothetical protein